MDPFRFSLSEASRLIHTGKLSPTELVQSLLDRIEKLEPKLDAWTSIDRVGAIRDAERYSKEAAQGRVRGPLHGIPIGVKDIIFVAGLRTTAGSKILADFVPNYDATVIVRLKEAGAIILGKTETVEFAVSDPAPTRNPWNIDHTPGGSSSGSAAAVSSGMCPAALGSQTGGSTIRPASYCGIIGLKPTYGRISRYGVIPVSWSLDHVGVLTRTVEDAAIMLEALAGEDPADATCSTRSVPAYSKSKEKLSPPRIALLREFFHDNASDEVRKNIEEAAGKLEKARAEIVETPLPKSFKTVHAAWGIVFAAEAAAYHREMFQKRTMDYGPQIRSTIATGLLVSATTYLRAQRIRSRFIQEIGAALKGFDCFLTPSTTCPAPKGLGNIGDPAGRPSFNSPWSFCGFPSITVPSGLTIEGLPLGIQLLGLPFDEQHLLNIARWCERTIGFKNEPIEPRLLDQQ